MATAGSIVIDLLMRTGSFETDSKRAEKRMRDLNRTANDVGKAIGGGFKTAVTQLLAFTGVAIGLDSAVSSLKNAIDSADQLRDASIRLGIGVETLSAYRYAAQQTGTDLEELNKGILRLAKNAQTALDPKSRQSRLFEALGISKESLSDLDSLIPQIADRFNDMADGATKAALAQELFGKSGANLIEFLNQGSEGLKRFEDRARELGIIISQDTANAADEFNDKLADLKTAGQGLALQVAEQLMPSLTQLIDWATDFVSDGSNAEQIAKDIADGFHGMTEAAEFFADVVDRLSSVRQFFADLENWNISSFVGKTMSAGDALKSAFPWLYKEIGGKRPEPVGGPASADPIDARITMLDPVTVTPDSGLDKRLAAFFSGSDKAGSKTKDRISDQEKAAKRLGEQFEQMKAQLLEQIALTGEVSEVERLRYELANGEMKDLTEGEKKVLLQLAQTAELRQKDYELLKKQIEAEEEHQKAVDEGVKRTAEMIEDMELELSLIGMSNEARAQAIALRYADADATEEQRARIADLAVELERTQKTADFFNDTWSDIGDAFVDVASRSKTGLEAVGDVLDNLYKRALQFVADQAIQALLGGATGAAGGGASAGSLMDLFSGAFMGGMAGGGSAMANHAYLIGEQGPELFVPRTAGAILPASETSSRMGGNGNARPNITNILVQPTTTRRTADQIAQANERKQRTTTLRNG